MRAFNEDAFDSTVDIVASALEETGVELSTAGGAQVGDFFAAIYDRLSAIVEERDVETPAKPGSFEVYEDGGREYRFRLKAGNGEIIAVSEGYKQKASCLKGIESVRKNAAVSEIKDV